MWGRIGPGNKESAGKRLSGKTATGTSGCNGRCVKQLGQHPAPRTLISQLSTDAAWCAEVRREPSSPSLTPCSFSTYHLLQRGCPYGDLGADYFDRKERGRLKNRLVKRLTGLGYQVTLTPTFSRPTTETA